jgi:predicted dehydrogenase
MTSTLAAILILALQDPPIKAGIIGTDTSHAIAFTRLLNDNPATGIRVVAAFKGGSPDIEASFTRVDKFSRELQEKHGVEPVESVAALLPKVDVVLLLSVDGRPHLEQARPVFAAKKRVFIDKPLAGSLKDAREIARLSAESGTPFFSASSVRFYETIVKAREEASGGALTGCDAWAPASLEKHHPDLFWYGIHGVEALYSVMGPGCASVTRVFAPDTDLVVGRWKDGRTATFRGIRKGQAGYGVTVFREKAIRSSAAFPGKNDYGNLVAEIAKFFKGGPPPVSVEEMLEVLAFMEAADLSRSRGGAAAALDEVGK